jgi:hypothetical protein
LVHVDLSYNALPDLAAQAVAGLMKVGRVARAELHFALWAAKKQTWHHAILAHSLRLQPLLDRAEISSENWLSCLKGTEHI